MLVEKKREKTNDDSLKELIYNISYDLKTPARTMACFTELLVNSLENNLNQKQKEYLQFIQNSSKQLNQIVTSLGEFSKLTNSRFIFEQTNVCDILRKLKNEQSDEISMSWSEIPEIFANRTQIKTIFSCLIDNSILFKQKNTVPKIEISHMETENEIVISYRDNSIGVEQEFHQDIFKIFYRLETNTKVSSGLGLAIVKKIIENHGAKLKFSSTSGKGVHYLLSFNKEIIIAE